MNEKFSKGDLEGLRALVTDGMFSKLNPEIKKAKSIGEYEWKYHGDAHRPRLIHVSQAKLPMPEGELTIVQATVEIQIKQVIIADSRAWLFIEMESWLEVIQARYLILRNMLYLKSILIRRMIGKSREK